MRYYSLFFIAVAALIWGCNGRSSKDHTDEVYVGGRIENPTSEYFILSKDDKIVDTLSLDKQNHFGKRLENIEAGIYNFNHPPENQLIYLEPGDSILVWLNTLQFDESINFSGKGAEKSSFLLDMFLLNEQNNELILSYYRIEPSEFAALTDSIYEERTERLKDLKKDKKLSKTFIQLAETSIEYEYYHLRERYTFLIKKYYPELADKIGKDFHEYRKDIDFNKEELQNYYGYMNFIDDYLRTRSIERCKNKNIPEATADCYSLNSFENIKYRIQLADSLIENQEIKSTFLDRLAAHGIIFAKNTENLEEILKILEEIGYSEEPSFNEIKEMAGIQKRLLPGNNISDLTLRNVHGDTVELREINKQYPMITYHWSLYAPSHFRWQQDLIASLRKKYPEITFIGINIDEHSQETWQQTVRANNLNPGFEYQLSFTKMKPDLLKNYLNKLFFIDATGTIVQGEAQLNTPGFEREILEFLNEL